MKSHASEYTGWGRPAFYAFLHHPSGWVPETINTGQFPTLCHLEFTMIYHEH